MSAGLLINPNTGLTEFAVIPDVTLRPSLLVNSCAVYLPTGRHRGPNQGYGADHIWHEHAREMAKVGLSRKEEVPLYVLGMLKSGTPLFYEGGSFRYERLRAVRSGTGTVILELRQQRQGNIWTVLTAYSGTKTHGTRVGAVR